MMYRELYLSMYYKMNFDIDEKEVLRYLNSDENLDNERIMALIDQARKELNDIINFRYTYQKFPLEFNKNSIKLMATTLKLKGEAIYNHLKKSKEAYLMAATLGTEVDKKISLYDKLSISKSMVFDACATTAIEEGCDYIENEIKKEVLMEDKDITHRFSPGYGDLNINIQKEFLEVLKAPKKIGLTASKYNVLIPTKSVTAVIGVINEKNAYYEEENCQNCRLYDDCELRRKGIYCGAKR